MVADPVCDDQGNDVGQGMDSERCINCGNFEDSMIRSHRSIPRRPHSIGQQVIGQESEDRSAGLIAMNRRRSYGRIWKANTCR